MILSGIAPSNRVRHEWGIAEICLCLKLILSGGGVYRTLLGGRPKLTGNLLCDMGYSGLFRNMARHVARRVGKRATTNVQNVSTLFF